MVLVSEQERPDSRQAPIPGRPRFQAGPDSNFRAETRTWTRNLDKELGQGTWTNFITCFPLTEPLVQVRPGKDKELGQLRAAVLQALSVLRPDSRQAIPCALPRRKPELGQELGQVLSRVFLLQSHLSKFTRGTWTRNLDNCGLPCYKLSQYCAPIPGRPRFRVPLSLEGVFQMDYILPERLPALVRPAFDLVLRRIRSPKRCVQACGCKIMTRRYAPQFGSRLHFKRCQPLPKETPFPFFSGTPFFGTPFFLFFCFFLALQRLARLKCNLEPNCKHIYGSLFCSHTPARSVLDFESFAGRGQMLDGRVLGASQVECNPFGKRPLKREMLASTAPQDRQQRTDANCARVILTLSPLVI